MKHKCCSHLSATRVHNNVTAFAPAHSAGITGMKTVQHVILALTCFGRARSHSGTSQPDAFMTFAIERSMGVSSSV
jgi:hypothetical protein